MKKDRDIYAIILAAGIGKRMVSSIQKTLHQVLGKPMISYVIDTVSKVGTKTIFLVVSDKGEEEIKELFQGSDLIFVKQERQLGTGHAIMCAEPFFPDSEGDVMVLPGDMPLIKSETIKMLLSHHIAQRNDLTFLTVEFENPSGYGRIVREVDGRVSRIVEERDADKETKSIREVNSGLYVFSVRTLFDAIHEVRNDNSQGEFYLTDTIEILLKQGKKVEAIKGGAEYAEECSGINDRSQLAYVEEIMRMKKIRELQRSGVTIVMPHTVYIEGDVSIGQDSRILPYSIISGKTIVGSNCSIGPGAVISDSTISDFVRIKANSVIESALVEKGVEIGPFARIRPRTTLKEQSRIGNFVEIKKSTIGKGTKANHLSYIGDAEVGDGVNIGAGTITCNYDGFRKYETIIEDGAFIGSDSQLIAPVRVGKEAYIGSGSTITKDVPPGALAISRAEQRTREGWVLRKRAKMLERKKEDDKMKKAGESKVEVFDVSKS